MNTLRTVSTLALCAALAGACGGNQNAETADARDANTGTDDRSRGLSTSGSEALSTQRACTVESVYFAYDSAELDERSRATLDRNATCMRERPSTRITGSTDSRGTEEYNLALGDRRARSTARYLTMLGVEEASMTVGSVGEEYATGEDESTWARDRRADFEAR